MKGTMDRKNLSVQPKNESVHRYVLTTFVSTSQKCVSALFPDKF